MSHGYGGVIEMNSGTLTMTNCTIANNHADNGGGRIDAAPNCVVNLINCAITGNSTGLAGGGINTLQASVTLTNCTIADNSSGSQGAGLNIQENSATFYNCTIANNSVAGALLTFANTVVAGPLVFSGVKDLGYNLVQNTQQSPGFKNPHDVLNVNPLLAPLANYGGPTQTIALLPGCPAIGAGSTRWFPREPPPTSAARAIRALWEARSISVRSN